MPAITPIQMFAAPTSGSDSSVNIDIPADGVLIGIDWAAGMGGMDADGDIFNAELSFNSTNQRGTNDARAAISAVKLRVTAPTAAAVALCAVNKFVDLRDGLDIAGGERIYLHYFTSTGVSGEVIAILHFRFRTARRAATRRR